MRVYAYLALLGAAALGCATRPRDAIRPIPDQPSVSAGSLRGSVAAADKVSEAEQIAVIRDLVRTFYRPTRGQARWIDPQPLAHRRTFAADSASVPDDDWANALVQAIALGRVCVLDRADHECRGRPGGVLRFSRVYSAASDSAIVFARYDPVPLSENAAERTRNEMEFHMTRDRNGWRIESKRTVTAP